MAGVWGTNNGASAGFIDIHGYPYSATPSSITDVLAKPQTYWASLKSAVVAGFAANAPGSTVPDIGITEYNIVCCDTVDTSQLMTRAVNLHFIADSIGALATNGFKLANAWDMVRGVFLHLL